MIKIISIFVFFFLTLLQSSESNGCVEEIAAEKQQLALTKSKHAELLAEMEKFDKHLDEHIALLDYEIVSSLDESINIGKSRTTMQKSGNSVATLVDTENIVAKTRLVYLKAAILRYQFYVSQMSEEELREFNNEK